LVGGNVNPIFGLRMEVINLENQIEKQIDEMVGALTDPIVVYPGGWMDVVPENLKSDITIHRLAQLMKGEEGLATWPEVCAYLMTVTLEFPVASEWVNIYMYALTQYKGDMVPKDIRQDRLGDYEMGLLNDFRRWIYERRLKERKRRQHTERLKETACKRQEKAKKVAHEPGQMALPFVFEAEYEAMGVITQKPKP